MSELQKTIDDLGRAFHEFKSANEERIEKLEKGEGVSDVETKLEKLNDKLDEVDGLKTRLEEMETRGNRIAGLPADKLQEEYKTAFGDFLRKGREDGLSELQQKAVSVGTEADGGYAVPEELDRTILQLEREQTPMRAVCNQMTVSNEEYKKLVNLGGAGSGWVGETAARPETNSPQLAQIAPSFGELYANPATTQKALDDLFFNVEAWLSDEVGLEFAEQENAAFTVGNATNKPSGILNATLSQDVDGTRTFGQIQYRLSGTDSALGADDDTSVNNLIDLSMDLRAGYRNAASWMMPRGVLRMARKLRTSEGVLAWQPSLQRGQPSLLLDYPVVENEDLPAVGAESNSVLFGNFTRGYTIYDVRGVRVLRDPYTNKPYVHFYTTKRVGGVVTDSQAIKVLRLGDGA